MERTQASEPPRLATPPPDQLDAGPVRLERLRSGHVDALFDAVSRTWETLHPWFPWAAERPTREAQADFVRTREASWQAGTDFPYAMLLDGALVGLSGLHHKNRGSLEMGYWLDRAVTGHGYATRAARTLTTAALQLAEVETVEIHCDAENAASAAIPRRLGFELAERRPVQPAAPAESGVHLIWRVDRVMWRNRQGNTV